VDERTTDSAPDRASDLPSLSIRRPWLVVVLNLLIVIAGLAALLGVEVRELPNIDRPIVAVRADYPGAAPETLDAEVTWLIEGAAARVPGVYAVRSASEEGNPRAPSRGQQPLGCGGAGGDGGSLGRSLGDLRDSPGHCRSVRAGTAAAPGGDRGAHERRERAGRRLQYTQNVAGGAP
jgi:hypothetical protein